MKTKFGTAKIYKGYYWITSRREGNKNKLLHRLIWEDFYNTEVPKGYVIHHKNGDKLCNCILNLQLMSESEHNSLHNTDRNTSGYFRVNKAKCKSCKQGFVWRYQYYEGGKRKSIESVSIEKLKEKVKSKGLIWKKLKSGEF